MKKVIFVGMIGCGKTTLIQRLQDDELIYTKTQTAEFIGNYIDTPGEYLEKRSLYRAIITLACEADVIAVLQDCGSDECYFPQGFAATFPKPVIGIATKIDKPESNPKRALEFLEQTGAERFFITSALTGEGVAELLDYINSN